MAESLTRVLKKQKDYREKAELIHKIVLAIEDKVPGEYPNSATFSLAADSLHMNDRCELYLIKRKKGSTPKRKYFRFKEKKR